MFQNHIKQQERCQDFYLYDFLSFSASSRTFVTCAVAKYWIFKISDISTFLLFYFILFISFNYCNENNNLHNLTGKEKVRKTSHDIWGGYISRKKKLPRNSYFGSVEKRCARYSVCWQYKLNKINYYLAIYAWKFHFHARILRSNLDDKN